MQLANKATVVSETRANTKYMFVMVLSIASDDAHTCIDNPQTVKTSLYADRLCPFDLCQRPTKVIPNTFGGPLDLN